MVICILGFANIGFQEASKCHCNNWKAHKNVKTDLLTSQIFSSTLAGVEGYPLCTPISQEMCGPLATSAPHLSTLQAQHYW